jgi:hypothetical protein
MIGDPLYEDLQRANSLDIRLNRLAIKTVAGLLISDVVDVLSPVPIFLSQLFINKAQTLVHCYGQPQLPTLHFR